MSTSRIVISLLHNSDADRLSIMLANRRIVGQNIHTVKADAIETADKTPEAWNSQPMMVAGILFARLHQLKLVC